MVRVNLANSYESSLKGKPRFKSINMCVPLYYHKYHKVNMGGQDHCCVINCSNRRSNIIYLPDRLQNKMCG